MCGSVYAEVRRVRSGRGGPGGVGGLGVSVWSDGSVGLGVVVREMWSDDRSPPSRVDDPGGPATGGADSAGHRSAASPRLTAPAVTDVPVGWVAAGLGGGGGVRAVGRLGAGRRGPDSAGIKATVCQLMKSPPIPEIQLTRNCGR